MYLEFYNLKKEPFSLSPDPSFLFQSEAHKEALAHLRYGLIQKKGFILITGEVGTGKTTLINALLEEIPQEIDIAYLANPKLTRDEFFTLIANQFKLGSIENKAQFLINITEFLENAHKSNKNVVLIIDEVHQVSNEILEEIRLLSNLETPNAKLLNIILVGQPEIEEKINKVENRALKQRITLRYSLSPLNFDETIDYIVFRLTKAGAQDLGIFSQKALKTLYEYSHGIPRVINLLADYAMLTGFVKDIKKIDDRIIKECARELDLETFAIKKDVKSELIRHKSNKWIKALIILVCLLAFGAIFFFNEDIRWIDKDSLVSTLDKIIDAIRWQ